MLKDTMEIFAAINGLQQNAMTGRHTPEMTLVSPQHEHAERWWSDRVPALSPRQGCESIVRGLPGSYRFAMTIDGEAQSFIVDAEHDDAFVTVSFDFGALRLETAVFRHGGLIVDGTAKGEVLMRCLLANLIGLAGATGARTLEIDVAGDYGTFWAASGALPMGGAILSMSGELLARFERLAVRRDLEPRHEHEVKMIIVALLREPRALWALAARDDEVTNVRMRDLNGPRRIRLGPAITDGLCWRGRIDLKDPLSLAILDEALVEPQAATAMKTREALRRAALVARRRIGLDDAPGKPENEAPS